MYNLIINLKGHNINILEACPKCKLTSKVEYLGVIIEDGVNYKLFRCDGKNVEYYKKHDILYFKHSKETKSSEIIHFRDYTTKKESQIRKLLRSRIVCPRFDEHSKKVKNHKYIFVRSYGNSNRHYCICHEKNKKNRYEFIVDNKKIISIREFFETHDVELYEKLLEIHKNIKISQFNNFVSKEKKILELLFKIGLSDKIISALLRTNQSRINRIKLKKDLKRIMAIRIINFNSTNVFNWKIKAISKYKIKAFYDLLKEYGFKQTSEIKIAEAKDVYGES